MRGDNADHFVDLIKLYDLVCVRRLASRRRDGDQVGSGAFDVLVLMMLNKRNNETTVSELDLVDAKKSSISNGFVVCIFACNFRIV